jgi:hypothetical protein
LAIGSALAAPVALIGGWTLAAGHQSAGFNSVRQTISALAAHGASDRGIMSGGLFVLGASHLVTAAGLRPARRAGRLALGLGGVATVAVASFPQPRDGSSTAHTASAAIAFAALSTWPLLATTREAPGLLARPASMTGSAVLLGLLAWFAVALNGDHVGLAERALAGGQALWPLAVVATTVRGRGLCRGTDH